MTTESLEQELDDSIFNGILFAIIDDSGPQLRINASTLNDREALATAIQGITAVGLGEENIKGLFGPLPVQYNSKYQALIYIFNIEATTSTDSEIIENGLFCAIFIIFKKEMFHLIANVFSMIESLLNVYQQSFLKTEETLQLNTLQLIYEDLVFKLKIKPRVRVFKVENGITVEFEEKKVTIDGDLIFIIHEKDKKIYYYQSKTVENKVKEKTQNILKYINRSEYQESFKKQNLKSKKKLLLFLEENDFTIIN